MDRDAEGDFAESPLLLYLAFGAAHSPHHAPKESIDKYKGRFDAGWDIVRRETLARQKTMGLVPESTELPPHNEGVRAWDDLSATERTVFARQMEVFAAFLGHTDDQIGRLVSFLEQSGQLDNTLLMVMSDNGASPEGGPKGLFDEISYFNGVPESFDEPTARLDAWGSPESYPHYATGWAEAGNTPNRWYKSTVHEGGTRDPLIVHHPRHITDAGAIRTQFHHIVDCVPTILEVIGIPLPEEVRGHAQMPFEGTSFAYALFDGSIPTRKKAQYFEMFAHRAMWSAGWKAVALHWSTGFAQRIGLVGHEVHDGDFDADRWELYHLEEDFSEMRDLAAVEPLRLKELVDLWWKAAEAHSVLPLDDGLKERLLVAKPRVFEEREIYEYDVPIRLGRSTSPDLRGRSYAIAADIEVPEGGAEGVVVSNGGIGRRLHALYQGRQGPLRRELPRTRALRRVDAREHSDRLGIAARRVREHGGELRPCGALRQRQARRYDGGHAHQPRRLRGGGGPRDWLGHDVARLARVRGAVSLHGHHPQSWDLDVG